MASSSAGIQDCTVCSLTPGAFCHLSLPSRAAFNAVKFAAVYPAGAQLFVEGDMPRGVFVLCSGRAKVTTSSSEGKTLILRIAEPGEILGVSATVSGMPYEVAAETLEPAQLTFVKRADFLHLLETNAEICLNTVRQLSTKYHAAQREIRSLGLANTTVEKLAHLLLEWSDAHGTASARGMRIEIHYTHEQIAQMIGSTRETVTRLLAELRHAGAIEVNGAGVVITDRRALEALITT